MSRSRTSTARHRRIGAALAVGALLATFGIGATPSASGAEPLVCPGDDNSDYGPDPDQIHGTPSRSMGGVTQSGAVRVVPRCGPEAPTLTVRSLGFDTASRYARFGETVRHLDLDGDNYGDLLVSAPGQNGTGTVGIVFGSADGFGKGRPSVRLTPASLRTGDLYGTAVQIHGTYSTGGGYVRHVFVGAPGVDVGRAKDAGAVFHFRLTTAATVSTVARWVQGNGGVPGKAETGDRFGEVLSAGGPAAAAWTSGEKPFLAVGVPHEDVGRRADAGAVYVVHGSTFSTAKVLTQATRGAPGKAEKGDRFGAAVLATHSGAYGGERRNGVGGSAVYVGTPGEDVGRARNAGAVQRIAVGSTFRLTVSAAQGQFSRGVPGAAESGDQLGSSLAIVSFFGKGERELAAGAPGEDVGRATNAGAVTTLAFRVSRCKYCTTRTRDDGPPTKNDGYGTSLTPTYSMAQGDTYYGYRVGVPGADLDGRTNTGMIDDRSGGAVHGIAGGERLGEVPSALAAG